MAAEEGVSDDQESESEDCDTEADEGKINLFHCFINWLYVYRLEEVEGWAEDLYSNDNHPSHGDCLHHLPRTTHVPRVYQVLQGSLDSEFQHSFSWQESCVQANPRRPEKPENPGHLWSCSQRSYSQTTSWPIWNIIIFLNNMITFFQSSVRVLQYQVMSSKLLHHGI